MKKYRFYQLNSSVENTVEAPSKAKAIAIFLDKIFGLKLSQYQLADAVMRIEESQTIMDYFLVDEVLT